MFDKPPDTNTSNVFSYFITALGTALLALSTWLLKQAKSSQRPEVSNAESESEDKLSALEYTRFRREMRAITREEIDKLIIRLDETNNLLSENKQQVDRMTGRVQAMSDSLHRHTGMLQELNLRMDARESL